jgi:hypothetical protein
VTTAPGNSQITAPARAVDGARNSQITAPARAVDAHRCYTPPETKSGTGTAVLEFGYFFVGGGKGVSKTNIQVFGFIFFIFTRKCIANDICDCDCDRRIFSLSPRRGPQTKGLVKSA